MQIPTENVETRFFENIYRQTISETERFYRYELGRGRKILESEEECVQYLVVYGGMHYHKLISAFRSTQFENIAGRNIEIIDWGSGIATASCILIDYLIEKNIVLNVERITLIEPSIYATNKGCELLKKIFQDNQDVGNIIKVVNKSLDDLACDDFETNSSSIKVHLFSNIIDVQGIDLNHLYSVLTNCFQGINRIICISPYNDPPDRIRLDNFFTLFNLENLKYIVESSDDITGEIFLYNGWQFRKKVIKRHEKQFTINLTPF
jgi:hypothetical protein